MRNSAYVSLGAEASGMVLLDGVNPEVFKDIQCRPRWYWPHGNEVKMEAEISLSKTLKMKLEWFIPATDELVSQLDEKCQKEYAERRKAE